MKNFCLIFNTFLTTLGVMGGIGTFMVWMQWKFGVTEALNMLIFIGLSSYFTLIVNKGYLESSFKTKREKQNESILSSTKTVVYSTLACMVCGVPLLYTKIYVVYQFGLLLIIAMPISVYFSLIFGSALNFILGPELKKEKKSMSQKFCDYLAGHEDSDDDDIFEPSNTHI